MRRIGEHAVVIGGEHGGPAGGAGAARTPTSASRCVERDALPRGLDGRRAVPQGRHAHALLPARAGLPRGAAARASAPSSSRTARPTCRRAARRCGSSLGGHQFARASTGRRSILAGRPFIEGHVRRRVRALPGVDVASTAATSLGLTASPDGARVDGRADPAPGGRQQRGDARRRPRGGRHRARRARAGLARGASATRRPHEQRLARRRRATRAATCACPRARWAATSSSSSAPRPELPRAAVPVRPGGRAVDPLASAATAPSHRPPERPRRASPPSPPRSPRPTCCAALAAAEPLDDRSSPTASPPACAGATSGCAASRTGCSCLRRRRVLLQSDLRTGHDGRRRRGGGAARLPGARASTTLRGASSPRRARPSTHAWTLSVGADLALPEVQGRRSPRTRVLNRYLRRLRATAEHDVAVAGAFSAYRDERTATHLVHPRCRTRPARAATQRRGRRGPAADSVARARQSGISPSPVNSSDASTNEVSGGGRITSDPSSSSALERLPSARTSASSSSNALVEARPRRRPRPPRRRALSRSLRRSAVIVGEAVLALRRDPDDHALALLALLERRAPRRPLPWPSSAFIFARSSSTWLCEVSSCSWRSMSS